MSKRVTIESTLRENTGSTVLRRMRRENTIPAVIYGKDVNPVSITIGMSELNKSGFHFAENVLVNLDISGISNNKRTVMIKDIQRDPIKDNILHVDFHEISLKEKMHARIPVAIKGEAVGVAQGGIFDQILHEISVEAFPTDLPEYIDIDVTELTIGITWHISDISFPENLTILDDAKAPVVGVVAPRAEEEASAEEEIELSSEEPEVIKKGKKEDEAAE